jgi:hypothetical protein
MIYITRARMWVHNDHKLHLHGTWTAYLSIATEAILVFICFFGGNRFAQSVFCVWGGFVYRCLSFRLCCHCISPLFDLWIYESPLWYLQAFAESILRCRPINAIFVNMIDIIIVGAFCDSPKLSLYQSDLNTTEHRKRNLSLCVFVVVFAYLISVCPNLVYVHMLSPLQYRFNNYVRFLYVYISINEGVFVVMIVW